MDPRGRRHFNIGESQNIGHRIKPGLFSARPQRRVQRAAGKDHPILGTMGEFDALGRTGKNHRMVADNRAAPQRGKADIAGAPRTGHAVAAAHRALGEIDATARRRGAAEHERGAGRRVDLFVVMHFDDFDVVVLAERLRDALDQRREQVDAQTHVAGFHHRRTACGFGDRRFFLGRMAGGADDVHDAGGGGELGQGERRRRNGEFDQAVGAFQQRSGVTRNLDAIRAKPRKLPGIAADHGRTRGLDAPASVTPLVAAMA